ncbi:dTDP-4-dehydrorhamnose reductase [Chloroflexota bacterium]
MRIVIAGHKGQLGQALLGVLPRQDVIGVDLPEVDISEPASILSVVRDVRPEVVINSAAITDVDGCERDPERAFRVNAFGAQNLALACAWTGAIMLQISTNDVFDGRLGRAYYEWDPPSPQSVYARSKAAAEHAVRTLLSRFYIVRTAWLYARGGTNFPSKIIAAADRLGALQVVTDEVSAPTYAPDLAQAVSLLIRTEHFGIYHFTNSGRCSRYDWAVKILELSGRGHVPVEPITTEGWQRDAQPPLYAPIVNSAGANLGITLRPWEEALGEYLSGS